MANDVAQDHLVVIRIDGMHCHKCEARIQDALTRHEGVHEVEVDFPSGQASVLFSKGSVTIRELLAAIEDAGYRSDGFTQRQITEPNRSA